MKRYLAFFYPQYYPEGGMDDFQGSYDTVEEAISHLEDADKKDAGGGSAWEYTLAHIWDSETGAIVWRAQGEAERTTFR